METHYLIKGMDRHREVLSIHPCKTEDEVNANLQHYLSTYEKVMVLTYVLNENNEDVVKMYKYYQNGVFIYEHQTIF